MAKIGVRQCAKALNARASLARSRKKIQQRASELAGSEAGGRSVHQGGRDRQVGHDPARPCWLWSEIACLFICNGND